MKGATEQCCVPGVALHDCQAPSWGPFAASPDFVTVTFFWPLFLQVTSDFPQVLNFVLQGFDLSERGGCETRGLGEKGWPLPTFVGAEGAP